MSIVHVHHIASRVLYNILAVISISPLTSMPSITNMPPPITNTSEITKMQSGVQHSGRHLNFACCLEKRRRHRLCLIGRLGDHTGTHVCMHACTLAHTHTAHPDGCRADLFLSHSCNEDWPALIIMLALQARAHPSTRVRMRWAFRQIRIQVRMHTRAPCEHAHTRIQKP